MRIAVIVAALCLAAGCTGAGSGTAAKPAAPAVAVVPAAACDAEIAAAGPYGTFRIITAAKAKVFPAVVFVKPIVENYEEGEKKTMQVTGSGVLISSDGEVVTNFHVVEKAVSIRCMLFDGRHMDAEIVGTDKDTDLALLKLKKKDPKETFPYAALADNNKLTEGDFVMAMGAPWGLNRSVSLGIVSCAKRYIPSMSQYSLWIQSDASINPGNSGGPLVNTNGEVVGINSLGSMFGGDLGFSIPSNTVRRITDELRAHGKVARSWTGIALQPLQDFDQNMYFDATSGVIVAGTDPDSPATRAGFKNGDRIVKVQGEAMTAETDVDLPAARARLAALPADATAAVEVVRCNGAKETLIVTPRVKGKVEGDEFDCERWNMTVKSINQFDNPDLYFLKQEGVFVFATKYPGNAGNSGLGQGDIVVTVDGEAISSLDDMKRVYDRVTTAVPKRTRVVVEVLRGGLQQQIVLDFAREYKNE